ncbi:lysozyme, partial [Xylella fastidiosa subsp. multiplex]
MRVPLKQHQFDALVSLSFNIGACAFHRSTLLRKLNAGDVAGAAQQFHVWKWAGGRVQSGLIIRRAAERALFEGGDWRAEETKRRAA